jgi:secondary thiamine-phosphate synthase enzyme
MNTIPIRTRARCELVDITDLVQQSIAESGVSEGIAVVQSLHTTGALSINENADPDVARDMVAKLGALVPQREPFYRHGEGNSDSHVKTSLFGPSLAIIVTGGKLLLGTWQGVYFCEWDGPRERQVAVRVVGRTGSHPEPS